MKRARQRTALVCRIGRAFAFVLAVLSSVPAAEAGIVVASGDLTPVFSLTDDFPNPASLGNQQFFSNVLGAGTEVLVLASGLNSFAGAEVTAYYNSLAGVTSTLLSSLSTVTAADLAGKHLIVAPGPDAFTAAEIAAIAAFLAADGSMFVLGDGTLPFLSAGINDLLAGVGSGLSLGMTDFDDGDQSATGARIVAHSLTSGVTSFNYGATVLVSGGDGLFLTNGLQPFVAIDGAVSTPEPGTLTLLAIGLVALAGRRVRSL